jgi:hypothetical protein
MTTLGIDPATATGLAIIEGANLVYTHTETLPVTDYPSRVALLREVYAKHPWDRCAIEGQWVGDTTTPEGRAKAQGAQTTMRSAALWAAAVMEVSGIVAQTLQPSTWRSRMEMPGRLDRDQLKALALKFCRDRGLVVGTVDAAEALCIAFVLENSRQKPPKPKKKRT